MWDLFTFHQGRTRQRAKTSGSCVCLCVDSSGLISFLSFLMLFFLLIRSLSLALRCRRSKPKVTTDGLVKDAEHSPFHGARKRHYLRWDAQASDESFEGTLPFGPPLALRNSSRTSRKWLIASEWFATWQTHTHTHNQMLGCTRSVCVCVDGRANFPPNSQAHARKVRNRRIGSGKSASHQTHQTGQTSALWTTQVCAFSQFCLCCVFRVPHNVER